MGIHTIYIQPTWVYIDIYISILYLIKISVDALQHPSVSKAVLYCLLANIQHINALERNKKEKKLDIYTYIII